MKIIIGKLRATIAGDDRYTDILEVIYDHDDGTCSLEVRSSTPRGGMDGDPTPFYRTHCMDTLPPGFKAKELQQAVKGAIANNNYNFKRYGKPTRNFQWYVWYPESDVDWYGLSVKVIADVLDAVRG